MTQISKNVLKNMLDKLSKGDVCWRQQVSLTPHKPKPMVDLSAFHLMFVMEFSWITFDVKMECIHKTWEMWEKMGMNNHVNF